MTYPSKPTTQKQNIKFSSNSLFKDTHIFKKYYCTDQTTQCRDMHSTTQWVLVCKNYMYIYIYLNVKRLNANKIHFD